MALALVMALGAGALLDRCLLFYGIPADSTENFQLMAQAWNLINRYYVDRAAINHRNMTYAAINAMADSLGDTNHTTFLTRAQAKLAGSAVQGKLVGIGIEIQNKDDRAVVVAPLEGSPAEHAGVRPGDVILQVNKHAVTGLSLGQVSSRIAGEAGEHVELTVMNPNDKQPREISIARAAIKLHNVTWSRIPGTDIAHVRVAIFSDGAALDLHNALLDLERAGARGVILDIRNNPGGALDEAVATVSQFVSSGNVLWEKDASGKLTALPVQPGGAAVNLPLAVLVNNGSASDSEIVAGALHDSKRAVLIGETTFGTGTVLTEFKLFDGSALLLAVEEWLTPEKRSFWHKGIQPDIHVPMAPGIQLLRPTEEKQMTAREIESSRDVQLKRAIAWLSAKSAKK